MTHSFVFRRKWARFHLSPRRRSTYNVPLIKKCLPTKVNGRGMKFKFVFFEWRPSYCLMDSCYSNYAMIESCQNLNIFAVFCKWHAHPPWMYFFFMLVIYQLFIICAQQPARESESASRLGYPPRKSLLGAIDWSPPCTKEITTDIRHFQTDWHTSCWALFFSLCIWNNNSPTTRRRESERDQCDFDQIWRHKYNRSFLAIINRRLTSF